jgi:hypothetical protein
MTLEVRKLAACLPRQRMIVAESIREAAHHTFQ